MVATMHLRSPLSARWKILACTSQEEGK
jgi:hypothetical protein